MRTRMFGLAALAGLLTPSIASAESIACPGSVAVQDLARRSVLARSGDTHWRDGRGISAYGLPIRAMRFFADGSFLWYVLNTSFDQARAAIEAHEGVRFQTHASGSGLTLRSTRIPAPAGQPGAYVSVALEQHGTDVVLMCVVDRPSSARRL